MRFFCKYVYCRRKTIAAFLTFAAVFAVSFALYHLPVKAAVYPTLFCVCTAGIFAAVDYIGALKKHKTLVGIKKLGALIADSLPEAKGIDDEDYREIILLLSEEFSEAAESFSAKYRDMTEYYTVWVHQIKTPITSMRLSLEKEDTALSRKLSSDLFEIERYVEMALAFLRLDFESSDYVFKEYSVDTITEQAITKFAPEFIARKIHLNYTPSGKTAVTDEKWLSFVIEQILSNALKYTASGEIRIYMREPKTLCIEDTGIGIEPSDLPRVFEKGYTGNNGRKDKRASGIGLFLCKRICSRLNIEIGINSELNKGTTVCLDLKQYELKTE